MKPEQAAGCLSQGFLWTQSGGQDLCCSFAALSSSATKQHIKKHDCQAECLLDMGQNWYLGSKD